MISDSGKSAKSVRVFLLNISAYIISKGGGERSQKSMLLIYGGGHLIMHQRVFVRIFFPKMKAYKKHIVAPEMLTKIKTESTF